MFSKIQALISLIKALFGLVKYFKDWQHDKLVDDLEKKQEESKKNMDKLKEAKSEQEIWDAQKGVVNNKQ